MDDTNLHLTLDLGANTLRDLMRLNTSVAIDVGPNISKSVKYLVYGIVGCKVLQVQYFHSNHTSYSHQHDSNTFRKMGVSVLLNFYWQIYHQENHQVMITRNKNTTIWINNKGLLQFTHGIMNESGTRSNLTHGDSICGLLE
jgi:hypothetical protein